MRKNLLIKYIGIKLIAIIESDNAPAVETISSEARRYVLVDKVSKLKGLKIKVAGSSLIISTAINNNEIEIS